MFQTTNQYTMMVVLHYTKMAMKIGMHISKWPCSRMAFLDNHEEGQRPSHLGSPANGFCETDSLTVSTDENDDFSPWNLGGLPHFQASNVPLQRCTVEAGEFLILCGLVSPPSTHSHVIGDSRPMKILMWNHAAKKGWESPMTKLDWNDLLRIFFVNDFNDLQFQYKPALIADVHDLQLLFDVKTPSQFLRMSIVTIVPRCP